MVDGSVHPDDDEDPQEDPAAVRFSAASGQVHVEVHSHDPLEEEKKEEEEEELMSSHREGVGRGSTVVHL